MAEGLKKYFPMIRTREEIYTEIGQKKELLELYRGWNEEQHRSFALPGESRRVVISDFETKSENPSGIAVGFTEDWG